MGRSQYPTGSDLEAHLTAAGFSATLIATLDLEVAAAAGASQFEREAGRRMLGVTQTRSFDPGRVGANGFLDLRADLASLTGVAWNGTSYAVGTDVRAFPLNAAADGLPYSGLSFGHWRRFFAGYWPLPTLIEVSGAWGYGVEIPEDAWLGMLAWAGLLLLPVIVQAQTGGVEAWVEADMQERYGAQPLSALRMGWEATAFATSGGQGSDGKRRWGKYARIPVGG